MLKMQLRDKEFSQTALLAASFRSDKSISGILDQYISTVYTEHERTVQRKEQAMQQKLKDMSKIDWSQAFRVHKPVANRAKAQRGEIFDEFKKLERR